MRRTPLSLSSPAQQNNVVGFFLFPHLWSAKYLYKTSNGSIISRTRYGEEFAARDGDGFLATTGIPTYQKTPFFPCSAAPKLKNEH
jgi:hypothetical protein